METLTRQEELQCIYWDMYKDAYGVRPRGIDTSSWTEVEFTSEFEHLASVIKMEELARMESEEKAAERVEEQIAVLMATGARTRKNAIAWIHEAEGSNGDDEYLCFLLGLPYRYFAKV